MAAVLYACGGGDHANHDHEGHAHNEEAAPVAATMSYGADFDTTGAVTIESVVANLTETGSATGVYKATIIESCQKMGCWMSVEAPNQEGMMVYMNDHSFFVPKTGVDGLSCYINGEAYFDTLSVDFQKHLLEDANASQEEIDAITEEKYEIAFNAMGVVIEDYVASEGDMADPAEHDHDHDGHDHDHGDQNVEENNTEEAEG